MANNVYIAIGYKCNHHCSCCPCTKEDQENKDLTLDDVVNFIKNKDVSNFVVSGGEPTLNPQFIDIIKYLSDVGNVTVLSNSDRFSDSSFVDRFCKNIDIRKVHVVTTLHSYINTQHEWSNGCKGSFNRTISGLHNLASYGMAVTIKYCITPDNYNDIERFVEFIYNEFDKNIGIQFCGIDYVGMNNDKKMNALKLGLYDKNIERALDKVLEYKSLGISRNVYCLNIPLCHVDPYYWTFFRIPDRIMYNKYLSPNFVSDIEKSYDVGALSHKCVECDVKEYCMGSYKSAFDLYGDSFVNVISLKT